MFKLSIKPGGDPHQCDFHTHCDSEALQAQPVQVQSSSVLFDNLYFPTLPPATITPNQSIQIQERDNNLLTFQRQGCRG